MDESEDTTERKLLDDRIRAARDDLERRLVPEPPPFGAVRRQSQSSHRHLVLTVGAIAAVIAVVAGALVTRDPSKRSSTGAHPVKVRLIRSDKPRTRGDAAAIPAAVDADTAFAVDLYRQVASREKNNFFLSPHSISMALSMTMAGANGKTLSQMEKVLHLEIPEPAFHDAINALDQALTAPRTATPEQKGADPLKVMTANSLWGQAGYPFRRQFLDRIAESYAAGMNVVDFRRNAEESRSAINTWVRTRTDGKIAELIPANVIDKLTRLVLVNAITFKASWVKEFDPANPGPFTTADGRRVTAQMMSGGRASSASGEGWISVAVPYVGGASLVVIMPDDLARFEHTLTPELFAAAPAGGGDAHVTLPKFSITSKLDLVPALKTLGMTDAFDQYNADLSRIKGTTCRTDPTCLYVTAVRHEATIKVDERGTEAVAATAVIIGDKSAPPTIVINKPFLFAIRDDATGAILFTGRVTNPAG